MLEEMRRIETRSDTQQLKRRNVDIAGEVVQLEGLERGEAGPTSREALEVEGSSQLTAENEFLQPVRKFVQAGGVDLMSGREAKVKKAVEVEEE